MWPRRRPGCGRLRRQHGPLLCARSGCGRPAPREEVSMTTREIADRLAALCRAGKYRDAIIELYAPEVTQQENGQTIPGGRDAILAFLIDVTALSGGTFHLELE